MFRPDYIFDTVYDITPDVLEKEGIKAVIFDIDDTVGPHAATAPDDKCRAFIDGFKASGIKVGYISNNPLERDAFFSPLYPLARKPSKKGFLSLANDFGVKPSECLVVGDQLFTDVRGGKKSGMKTVKVEPITGHVDVFIAVKRVFEKILMKKYKKEIGR